MGALFEGQMVAAGDVLVETTWAGDTDLSGTVTLADYLRLDAGYLCGLTGWANGDFNYDGVVDYRDYALIDYAYAHQSGALAESLLAEHAAEFGTPYVRGVRVSLGGGAGARDVGSAWVGADGRFGGGGGGVELLRWGSGGGCVTRRCRGFAGGRGGAAGGKFSHGRRPGERRKPWSKMTREVTGGWGAAIIAAIFAGTELLWSATLSHFWARLGARTEAFVREYIRGLTGAPERLTEAMEYSLYGPGKRIRPALAILCGVAVGGTFEAALPAAGAVEMIHCFSLIHDDLPAMDDDDLRRGRPTNHRVYGEAMAILAGDGLHTMAFDLIARTVPEARTGMRLVAELALATGPEGMIGGQVLDTCYPQEAKAGARGNLEWLQRIHRMKTGALIRGACRMGAICGGATDAQLELVDRYGKAVGLAFQIVDDILDVTATAEQLGKKTGKDAAIGKLTYPSLLGMEASKKHLAEQVKITDEVVERLGPRAKRLGELARMMAERTS